MFTIKTKSGIKAEVSEDMMSDYRTSKRKGWAQRKGVSFDDLLITVKANHGENVQVSDITDGDSKNEAK